ncbi:MAG: hypothetical protein V4719_21615 [Planctomycetota bacterium]
MSYSVHFFGIDAQQLTDKFGASHQPLVELVAQRIRQARRFSKKDVLSTVSKVAAICEARLPADCDAEYFHALCWLAEVVGEKIAIPSFVAFRHIHFLNDTGVWQWLSRSEAPFSLPRCEDPPPTVGYINTDDMEQWAVPGLIQLPAADIPESRYARQEFLEVLESLVEDKLDLLAVLL